MSQTVEAEIARLKGAASKRKGTDVLLTILGLGACVTVLAPWLLGRFALRDTFFRGNGGVYGNVEIRQDGDYFLSDWLMGCAAILLCVALFLIVRPWSNRRASVAWGFILIGASAFFLIPTSQNAWIDAEFRSTVALKTTAYPFSDKWYTCGSETLRTSDNTLWQVHEARASTGQTPSGCNRLDIYAGWQEKGVQNLAPGEIIDKVNITPDGIVTVTTKSGSHGISFNLANPAQLL